MVDQLNKNQSQLQKIEEEQRINGHIEEKSPQMNENGQRKEH